MRKSVMLAGAFLLFAGATANASDWYTIEVNVPFPFVVTGHTFPAGQYRVEEQGDGSSLLLRGETGKHAATFVKTTPASRQESAGSKPALTFTLHENQYRLSSVWEAGREGWSVIGR